VAPGRVIAYGTVVASFTISDFSLTGLQRINADRSRNASPR